MYGDLLHVWPDPACQGQRHCARCCSLYVGLGLSLPDKNKKSMPKHSFCFCILCLARLQFWFSLLGWLGLGGGQRPATLNCCQDTLRERERAAPYRTTPLNTTLAPCHHTTHSLQCLTRVLECRWLKPGAVDIKLPLDHKITPCLSDC